MNADTLDAEEWQRALAALPIASRDVYFTPEYHNLHVANGDGDAVCVAVRDADAVLLVPGLRRPVPVTAGPPRAPACWDLESCNGYGGPLVTPGVRAAFLQDAWVETRRALGESGGVAAFFRLHPLVGNELLLPSDAIVQNDRPTVYVDLTHGLEQAWDRAESRHRNMVRKGRREGIAVCWNDPGDWSHFEALYGDAMTRLSAPERLRFTGAYFASLRRLGGSQLATVRDGRGLVAGAVFLFGPAWAHYHLAARRSDAENHVTSCLIQAGLERAAERELMGVFLGGGATRDPEDAVLKFKRSVGGELKTFRVALVVVDKRGYDQLVQEWTRKAGRPPTWLLGYRQPAELV